MNGASKVIIQLILDTLGIDKGLDEASKKFGGFKDAATEAAMKSDSEFRKFAAELSITGDKVASVGSAMTKKLTVPLVGGLGLAINEARKFESSFAGVKKTTDATAEQFDILAEKLKTMSTRLPANVNDINAVAEAAGQLGIKYKDIDKFTEVMINLGVATNLSADQAATQFARLQNIMGFTSADYERLGSVVVDLGNNFATSESEIMNFTMRLAPMGAQAGLTTPEIMGISTAFTSMGLTAEAGGTAAGKMLSMMNLSSTKGLGQMQALEKQLGMTGREMELLSSSNSKGFKALADSVGMTSTELSQVIKANKDLKNFADISNMSIEKFAETFQNDAAGALDLFFQGLQNANLEGENVIEMLADMGINEVRLRAMFQSGAAGAHVFSDALETSNRAFEKNTALQEEADKRYETLESQMTLAGNAIKVMAINLGEQLVPYIKQFTEWITKVATKLGEMSPEQFQKIAKAVVAIAAAGPSLSIVGKGFGVMHKAANLYSNTLGKLIESTGIYSKILKSDFMGGDKDQHGWTKGMLESIGGKNNTAGMPIGVDGKFLARGDDAMKRSIGLIDRMKVGIKGVGPEVTNMGKAFVSSPVFTGAIFTALIGYIAMSFKESESFRRGLETLWEGIKGLFSGLLNLFGPLGDMFRGLANGMKGVVSVVDLLVIAFGILFNTLAWGNPIIGGIVIAVGALKILTSAIGWVAGMSQMMADSNEHFNTYAAGVEGIITPVDELADTALPKLGDSLDGVIRAMDGLSENSTAEDFQLIKDNTTAYFEDIKSTSSAAYDELRAGVDAFYADLGQTDSEAHLAAIEGLTEHQTTTEDKYATNQAKLEEMRKLHGDNLNTWDEAAKNEYLRILEETYELAEQVLTPAEKRQEFRREELLNRMRDKTITMTAEEIAELAELTQAAAEKDALVRQTNAATALQALKLKYGNEYAASAEYQKEYDDLMKASYAGQQNAAANNYNDLATKAGLFNIGQLTELAEQQNELKRLNAKFRVVKLSEEEAGRRDELNALKVNSQENKDLMNESIKWMDEVYGPGFVAAFTNKNGDINYNKLIAELGKQKTDFKEVGTNLGASSAAGIQVGLEKKENELFQAGLKAGRAVQRGYEKGQDINSPSRVMAALGRMSGDGIIVGLESSYDEVEAASAGMAALVADHDYSADAKISVQREIMDDFGFSGESKLSSSIAKSVASELAKITVRATIDEDDFNSGVRETLRNDMSR